MTIDRRALLSLNALEDNAKVRQRFAVPNDLRWLAGAVVLLIVIAIGFGWIIRVDQMVQAQGILETEHRLFEIRSPLAGQLSQTLASRGQTVSPGMVLAELETAPTQYQLSLLQAEQSHLEHTLWRHFYLLETLLEDAQAQRMLAQLDPIPDPLTHASQRQPLRQQIQSQLNTLRAEQDRLRSQQLALQEQMAATKALLDIAQAETQRLQSLVDNQLESPARLAQLEQVRLQHQRDWIQLLTQLPTQQAQWQQLEAQRQQHRLTFTLAHQEQFEEARSAWIRNQIAQQQQRFELAQHQIRAPAAGTLDEIFWHGQGEVIQAHQPLAMMRPEFTIEQLWVEIEAPATDIIWIQPEQTFRATVKGRGGDDHGVIHGRLGFISSVITESESAPERYMIRGEIERFEASPQRPDPTSWLRPGLPLEVTIQAGERRLLHYLLDPFRQTLKHAWREPA